MKIHLTDMITRPEPSAAPAVTLVLALISAACLACAVAAVVMGG